jgi:hypothetical protein
MKSLRPITSALLSLFLLTGSLFAQRTTGSLSRDFEARWNRDRAEAESLATTLHFPIRSIAPDGTVRELKRLRNGRPVYYKTDNVIAGKTISTDKVYPGGAAGYNLTGNGITLGEWDGGGVRTTHQEFGGRVLMSQGTLNFHSTHVAGTMIAAGVNPPARGMAFAAQLKEFDWSNDNAEMLTQAAAGLRVSNHSYGLITGWDYNYFNDNRWEWWGDPSVSATEDYSFGFYDQEAQDWDAVAYNSPYYLIVKSAGNDRDEGPSGTVQHWEWNGGWTLVTVARPRDGNNGYDCLAGASVAKDPLIVGAVGDIAAGYSTPSDVVMSSFSAWGPTDDGRIKPDIVANGTGLFSTFETSNTAYGTLSGTSMAAPSVTGSIGLLLEHEQNLHPGDSLLASTVKGIIIHTADEAGTDPGPDYRFGWGLMNTRKAVDLMQLDSVDGPGSHIRELGMSTGDTILIDLASTGSEPLRATISWNDIPVGLPPVSLDPPNLILRNDVDMRLIRKSDGAVFYPWVLDPANPSAPATTGDNFRDNVEQVLIDAPGRTLYTLRLTHKTTIYNSPMQVSLIMSGNTSTLGAAIAASPDSVSYAVIPGSVFSDSLRIHNGGDSLLAGSVTKDPGSFWLSLTEDSINIPPLDSTVIHFSVNGSLWSQWTEYNGGFTFHSNDVNAESLVVPVAVSVLGPKLVKSPASFLVDLDSAEVGHDTLKVKNTGFIPLHVVVADTGGPLPAWISANPDTLTLAPGDSAAVAITTNALNEPLGDYSTVLRLASNDSSTGDVLVPFFLNIGTRTLFSVDVTDRWNLVSLPVDPVTGLKTALFPTAATAAFGYDDGYYQADTLRTGPGYWMKFGSSQSFLIDGYTYETDTIPVAAGWNIVGSLFEPVPVSAVTTSPSGILTSAFYGYGNGYLFADSIRPGRGYWVQADQAGEIYLTTLPGAAPKTAGPVRPEGYSSITISDGTGASQSLYFGTGVDAPRNSAMPPRPPKGGFDARFSDESFFAGFLPSTEGTQSKTIVVSGAGSVITVSARLAGPESAQAYSILDAEGTAHTLTDGGAVSIPAAEGGETSLRLVSGREDLPTEFALGQNYPNPFNPSTKITFSLPTDETVSIRLFNILGNEVAAIAERRYEAGRHSVEFNAESLPSGVYIYTMRAGSFSASRKMVVMR